MAGADVRRDGPWIAFGVLAVTQFVVCTSDVAGPAMGAASGLVSTTLQVGGALGVVALSMLTQPRAAGRRGTAGRGAGTRTANEQRRHLNSVPAVSPDLPRASVGPCP